MCKFAPASTAPVRSALDRSAPVRSTPGLILYPRKYLFLTANLLEKVLEVNSPFAFTKSFIVQNPEFLVVILLPFNEHEPETDQTLVPRETVSAIDEVAYPVDGNIDGTFQVKIGALAALSGFINTDEDKSPRGTTHKITRLNIILPQSSAALLLWVLLFCQALLPFQFSTCQRLRQDI